MHSIDDALRRFSMLFGARVLERVRVKLEAYTWATFSIINGQALLELIEPSGEDGFVCRCLRERGPGFHHITLEVSNSEAATARLRAQAMEPYGGLHVVDRWKQTLIHPRDSNGILVQLFEPNERAPSEHPT